jgi:hypothetical protein
MIAYELRRRASEVAISSSPSYGQRSETGGLLRRAASHIEDLEETRDALLKEVEAWRYKFPDLAYSGSRVDGIQPKV